MKWIQVSLVFHPEARNVSRPGGFGVWKVWHCSEVGNPLIIRIDTRERSVLSGCAVRAAIQEMEPFKVLRMMSARPYRANVIVNPRKILREYLEACNTERERVRGIIEHKDVIYFGSLASGKDRIHA